MIRDRKQILAIASPVRLALIDTLEGIGPSSVAKLAAIIGARPDALYYHLRILEERGLVARVGGAEASQAVFKTAEKSLKLLYDPQDPQNRDAVSRVVASMARGALRAFRLSFRGRPRVNGKRRELWAGQQTAHLTGAEIEKVNRLLNDLVDTFANARRGESGERLYALTFMLSPYGKGE
jgi:DNA-binding transcriptional ArsR family regulator